MKRNVTRQEFDEACAAVWSEITYQDGLPRRTDDEANSVPSFLTLLRRYLRKVENDWADQPGTIQRDGQIQVEDALNGLRKLAAIGIRSMIYNGTRSREAAQA